MKTKGNLLTLGLMISSILLLLILQVLWLRGAYYRASEDLTKETNLLFRNTVLAMRDSILERNIEPIMDSLPPGKVFRFRTYDSSRKRVMVKDTLTRKFDVDEKDGKVRVMITTRDDDSLMNFVKPLASKFSDFHGEGTFILRLGTDTLSKDSLHHNFQSALRTEGIDVPFEIIVLKRDDQVPPGKGFWVSDQIRINQLNSYAVTLSTTNPYLISKIIPEVLFSLCLTILTTGAFIVMYRSLRSQQRMAEIKNDFISNVTHELKTPITTVRVAIEALRDFKGLDNPQLTREYLDIAQNELNRLTLLTDKVLKTAIFESSGVSFESRLVDLEKILDQILGSMKLVFDKNNAVVELKKEGTAFVVLGSEDHLTNVVYNLIDNALKYSAPRPEIAIHLKEVNGQIVFSVRDNGIGIPPEYQKKIFEKFFRVPTGDVHNVKGYGLGLSYVASVIRSHHGSIKVDSVPGNGSCFTVTLPRK